MLQDFLLYVRGVIVQRSPMGSRVYCDSPLDICDFVIQAVQRPRWEHGRLPFSLFEFIGYYIPGARPEQRLAAACLYRFNLLHTWHHLSLHVSTYRSSYTRYDRVEGSILLKVQFARA